MSEAEHVFSPSRAANSALQFIKGAWDLQSLHETVRRIAESEGYIASVDQRRVLATREHAEIEQRVADAKSEAERVIASWSAAATEAERTSKARQEAARVEDEAAQKRRVDLTEQIERLGQELDAVRGRARAMLERA